jgi:hypothetical protein
MVGPFVRLVVSRLRGRQYDSNAGPTDDTVGGPILFLRLRQTSACTPGPAWKSAPP